MFTWIPVYQKIAQHVALFQHKQPQLIAVLDKLGIGPLTDQQADGSTFPLYEIDGLTFFRYLNRGSKQKRLQLLRTLCNLWKLSPLPEDVDGLPEINALNVWLFPAKALRTNNEIQRLWDFYKAIINDAVTDAIFQDMLRINGVGKVKLTEAMFMLRPDKFLCLNRSVKSFLHSIHLSTDFNSLEEYISKIGIAKEVFTKSFPELSKEAAEYIPGSFVSEVAEEEVGYGTNKPAVSPIPLNTILYGPPGTGKTYTAIDKALLIADANFYKEHQADRPAITRRFQELLVKDYDEPLGQIAFCTFHQSMSYEDFVEGIKPEMENEEGGLHYRIKDGIFKIMAGIAAKKGTKKKLPLNYVLIIDEINRGNVSAILGELITLIEDNKRTGKNEALIVTLPYSKKPFSVPPNLYIIGTMNTADRGVEALDTALRRRFVFEEILPKPNLLSPQQLISRLYAQYPDASWKEEAFRKTADGLYHLLGIDPAFEYVIRDQNDEADMDKILAMKEDSFKGINLEKLLTAINKRLTVLLSADYTIGHAWLMDVYSLADLQAVFQHKILPLLQEYFLNNYAKIGMVLGNAFVKQEPVPKGLFASFTDRTDTVNEYSEKIKYTLVNPLTLPLKAFCSIYQ